MKMAYLKDNQWSTTVTHLLALCVLLWSELLFAEGNERIESFSKAKHLLLTQVYSDHRETLYCQAEFKADKSVIPLEGFQTSKYHKRALRVEWEHAVAAENFGRTFVEWREGHPDCVDSKGEYYKGRTCASKMNPEYRRMQADLNNLFPAIGAVNALRSNFRFSMLPGETADFGSCAMKIEDRKAEPPEYSRGRIARAHLYMAYAYPRFTLSNAQQKLMFAWHKKYPVTAWECERARRIEAIQGNRNPVVQDFCRAILEASTNLSMDLH
ncbi:MAG: endonuclease [Pseudomonadales bacterium]|nr:endonuclease [Pseudomonadales bacterium]